jgi:hypothetical protein
MSFANMPEVIFAVAIIPRLFFGSTDQRRTSKDPTLEYFDLGLRVI